VKAPARTVRPAMGAPALMAHMQCAHRATVRQFAALTTVPCLAATRVRLTLATQHPEATGAKSSCGAGARLMTDRHPRDVQIVLVPVPVAGCPEPHRQVKPGKYPLQRREAWRPATSPPSKAAASVNLLRQIAQNEAAVRSMLKPTLLTR
jgi:hypothetical protein